MKTHNILPGEIGSGEEMAGVVNGQDVNVGRGYTYITFVDGQIILSCAS
jgi:hypothetical protein